MYLLIGIVVVVLLYLAYVYNHLTSLVNRTNEAWGDIDVFLKRRYDLIPNLVTMVKAYSKHEKELFENIANSRADALSAKTASDKETADGKVVHQLHQLLAIAEDYPELRASENFQELQKQLVDTEDVLASARKFYNGNVRELNIAIESFPQNILANLFHFQKKDFFEASEDEKTDVSTK